MNDNTLLSKKGAARYLLLSEPTIERFMRAGDLPYIKLGDHRSSSVRFLLSDLAGYVERRRRVARTTDSAAGMSPRCASGG